MASNVPSITLNDVSVTAPAPRSNVIPLPSQPSVAPYARRRIDVTFLPASGKGKTFSGIRCLVQVTRANMGSGTNATIRMWGLTLNDINQLTMAGTSFYFADNRVKVEAGDIDGPLASVFSGIVQYAAPDFQNQPDCAFVIEASGSTDIQLQPAQPQTFNRPNVSIDDVLNQILKPAGISLDNRGVTAALNYPYFPGTIWTQIARAVKAANAMAYYDPIKRQLIISPKPQFGDNTADKTILIDADHGMIGYPSFQHANIVVRCLFSPGVFTGPQDKIRVVTELKSACGVWTAYQVDLALSSELPNGPWEMIVMASPDKMQARIGG